MQEVFTLSEAQTMQGRKRVAIKDYMDEHGRRLIPQNGMCRVVGLDAWDEHSAIIVVQYNGRAGGFPKVVLMNKTIYQEYFEKFIPHRGCQDNCVTFFHIGTRSPNRITN